MKRQATRLSSSRWRASEWDMGTGSSRETVWRVTTNLADKLLVGIR